MVKKLYFIFLLFFSSSAFSQKIYIQRGRLIDGISDTEQKTVKKIVEGSTIIDIKAGYFKSDAGIVTVDGDPLGDIKNMKNVSFVMKEGKIYNQ